MVINRSFKLNIVITVMLAVMIFLPMDLNASQDDTKYSAGHFYYHSYPGYVSICGYIGDETDISIPSSISGKPVSVIESGAFDGCDSIKTIEVPDTVIKVADDSFTGAGSLEKIVSHTVDVNINVSDGVDVNYTEKDSNEVTQTSKESKQTTSEHDVDLNDNENSTNAGNPDTSGDITNTKNPKSDKNKDSDALVTSDIGEGSFTESDKADVVKNDNDRIEQKKDSDMNTDKQVDDMESKKLVTADTVTEPSVDETYVDQNGSSEENGRVSYGVVVLCVVVCMLVIAIVLNHMKRR